MYCISCGYCYAKHLRRGCCTRCYNRYRDQVQRQETTWSALEQQGRITPSRRMSAERRAHGVLRP